MSLTGTIQQVCRTGPGDRTRMSCCITSILPGLLLKRPSGTLDWRFSSCSDLKWINSEKTGELSGSIACWILPPLWFSVQAAGLTVDLLYPARASTSWCERPDSFSVGQAGIVHNWQDTPSSVSHKGPATWRADRCLKLGVAVILFGQESKPLSWTTDHTMTSVAAGICHTGMDPFFSLILKTYETTFTCFLDLSDSQAYFRMSSSPCTWWP